ncbi:hypothetical protein Pmar_PMAR010317 [Perkinsus marinus ATCC 50983]|uniref:Uncharacterized protein n=1 Tax=Perkinsus marinus (strain ATCC 50983 / TXsc) TaxID=423536 RepID=C5KFS6_PERM5|nr:hypothetical protein Pmar_PMAR010317 [Perkinsus marinus ATCC 50983]EER16667.1 hypothetical protein Pmar_PMAR010317 [Perkinsus marinus ATCC 50983]|eukprot:XP_002784871.1 hypothetical protein Pmar_PMAR010317 [Perkinsus marinus ATCC 50983]
MNVSSLTRFKIDTFDPMGATFARPWYIQEAELDDDALRKFTSALSPRGPGPQAAVEAAGADENPLFGSFTGAVNFARVAARAKEFEKKSKTDAESPE